MDEFSHPFMNNPEQLPIPVEQNATVESFFEWIKKQPTFPAFTRNHAILFLHACYWDLAAAKNATLQYATIRASSPELFENRDPTLDKIQQILNVA